MVVRVSIGKIKRICISTGGLAIERCGFAIAILFYSIQGRDGERAQGAVFIC